MFVGKRPVGHVSKQLCRPPAPPQTAAPVIIFRTIIRRMSIKTLIIQVMLFISSSTSLLYLNENLSSDAEAGSWAEVEAWAEAEAGEETPAVSWNLLDSLNT